MTYTVNKGYVILDENSEIIDWFDTLEDAEEYIRELETE